MQLIAHECGRLLTDPPFCHVEAVLLNVAHQADVEQQLLFEVFTKSKIPCLFSSAPRTRVDHFWWTAITLPRTSVRGAQPFTFPTLFPISNRSPSASFTRCRSTLPFHRMRTTSPI